MSRRMVKISSSNGEALGWISTELIVRVNGPGERYIEWIDIGGARRHGVVDPDDHAIICALVGKSEGR